MTVRCDIAVIGAGPAGMQAAATSAGHGAATIVVDEHRSPGGQVYRRQTAPRATSNDRGTGDRLRAELDASDATVWTGTRVWGLGGGPLATVPSAPFRIDALRVDHTETIEARALIICTGTHETIIPFPGWTLPGVIGLAAATILLKADDTLPGRRVVVAGAGPLLAAVAAGILSRGGEVAAIVDTASRRDWLRHTANFATSPTRLARGAGWLARIAASRVPIVSTHRIARAHGDASVTAVDIAPLAGGASRRIACDALCVGHGLTPATEATRLYGAAHDAAATTGVRTPRLDAWQRTSIPRLYAAGDVAGIAGADAAADSGHLAALAALQDLGTISSTDAGRQAASARARLAAGARFASAVTALMTPHPALFTSIPPGCVICRCEDVTRADIDEAARAGARDLNRLKQFTRCGMGPCQGRFCAMTAAMLLAPDEPARAGCFTPQIPLRPVPMEVLLGEFDYADIPIPAPAPL